MPARISDVQRNGNSDFSSFIPHNGFLPIEQPLLSLPSNYYEPWEDIMSQLPELLRKKTIRDKINNLSVLKTSQLCTEAEWRRAYVILSFLAHGYIWGDDAPSETLPPSVTVPFLKVSEHFELPPVATYAALNLWNFSCAGGDNFTDLDSLKALHTFSGTEDESWFYVLSVAVEAQGAHIIPVMLRAMDAVKHEDYGTVTSALNQMASCIRQLTRLLDRMSEKCDPMVFYHQIRPFLAGTKNMGVAGLPNGVFYDEGDGLGRWRELRGGSNGQSSLIQFFDMVLGIDHTSTGEHKLQKVKGNSAKIEKRELSFHEEVRNYMPGPHRKFLAEVSRVSKIKDFVFSQSSSPEQEQLFQAYQGATQAFGDFRSAHMQMVTRYIIVPSRKASPFASRRNLATASLQPDKEIASGLTGTGGTELIPFLRTTRDETYRAGLTAVISDTYHISQHETYLPVPPKDR